MGEGPRGLAARGSLRATRHPSRSEMYLISLYLVWGEDPGAAILALKTLELPFWRYSIASLFTLKGEVLHCSFNLKPSKTNLLLVR